MEEVNGFMVSVYADGDAQEISGVSASTGEWSDADVFEFIDMATAGGDPTYDGNGRTLRQIVHGFWFTGSGESVEELADRRGQLFQFTTGDAGTIHFELFMDWIDVASREGVWMRTDLTVTVVDLTASVSSASDVMVADSSFKPHMGFDAQFGSALVAALLATGGTEPEFALADLDGDGDADLADFAMFQAAFGTTGGTRYTWNTENRLTGVEPLAPNTDDKKLQFAYDHMGRRVLKRVWTYTAGSWGNPTAETKYVYDGWRVIMELDGLNSDAVTRKFTWGLDLSGSVEGAGGIGGLLATEDTAGTTVTTDDRSFIYLYELNGNVGQLVETTTGTDYGTIAAKYEYDSYGKRINTATQGEYDQPYRFSTKPVDDETGLDYWIKRYYSYDLGRWVSRDPIGERGGVNLYAYAGNSSVIGYDALGHNNETNLPLKMQGLPEIKPTTSGQHGAGGEGFAGVLASLFAGDRNCGPWRSNGKPFVKKTSEFAKAKSDFSQLPTGPWFGIVAEALGPLVEFGKISGYVIPLDQLYLYSDFGSSMEGISCICYWKSMQPCKRCCTTARMRTSPGGDTKYIFSKKPESETKVCGYTATKGVTLKVHGKHYQCGCSEPRPIKCCK